MMDNNPTHNHNNISLGSLADGESMFLRNVSICLRVYMAPKPTRTSSIFTSVPYKATDISNANINTKVL